jgi:hypothetical protein
MGRTLRIEDDGSIEALQARLGAMQRQIDKARKRTLVKLKTWIERQVAREVAVAAGTTQKRIKALVRIRGDKHGDGSASIWIGTNPIKAQYLGAVRWTRRMPGAKVGATVYPGTWSWGPGSKTGTAVMRRTGHLSAYRDAEGATLAGSLARALAARQRGTRFREGITEVHVPIHEAVSGRIEALLPQIEERFLRTMRHELEYTVLHEG